jgi:type II secretory pathway component PulF
MSFGNVTQSFANFGFSVPLPAIGQVVSGFERAFRKAAAFALAGAVLTFFGFMVPKRSASRRRRGWRSVICWWPACGSRVRALRRWPRRSAYQRMQRQRMVPPIEWMRGRLV